MKDKLNNENNNSEQSIRQSIKCDITNRKRAPDDALLSCIVVNNDLHGRSKNENNNLMPINMSKTVPSSVNICSSKNNR